MECRIVFSDVDGTLLDSSHKMLPGTLSAIRSLEGQGIPFVIVSARSPSGIYPIQEEYGFRCPIISYSGGLILDESRNVLYAKGFSRELAKNLIEFIESNRFDCSWNVYSLDTWIAKDRRDPRVAREESIVRAKAQEGTVDDLPGGAEVQKILCICEPGQTVKLEQRLKAEFPALSIARSSDTLLEIMEAGVTKGKAVRKLCSLWGISTENAAAFGDNYNDAEMLETVSMPFLMGNAPEELKHRFQNVTKSNDKEGIYCGLAKLGLVPEI